MYLQEQREVEAPIDLVVIFGLIGTEEDDDESIIQRRYGDSFLRGT